jgi:hypothetical protein
MNGPFLRRDEFRCLYRTAVFSRETSGQCEKMENRLPMLLHGEAARRVGANAVRETMKSGGEYVSFPSGQAGVQYLYP